MKVYSVIRNQGLLPKGGSWGIVRLLLTNPRARRILGAQIVATLVAKFGGKNLPDVAADLMEAVNGESARVLADKVSFVKILRDLCPALNMPRQALVYASSPLELSVIERHIAAGANGYIVKPVNGVLCRDVAFAKDRGQLRQILAKFLRTGQDAIVQNFIPFNQKGTDVRLYITRDGNNRVWADYQMQPLPMVVGDGSRNVRELIVFSEKYTRNQKKQIVRLVEEAMLKSVPNRGQTVRLTKVRNQTPGLKGTVPSLIVQQNLDRVVAELVTVLDENGYLGRCFNLCIDAGILDVPFETAGVPLRGLLNATTLFEAQEPYAVPQIYRQAGKALLFRWIFSLLRDLSSAELVTQDAYTLATN
jgi:hypothetical protein